MSAAFPHPYCFVVSAPRSGSTWLKAMLNQHPDVLCVENRLFGRFAEIWPNNDGSRSLRATLDEYVDVFSTTVDCQALGMGREDFRDQLLERYVRTLTELSLTLSKRSVLIDKLTPYLDTADTALTSIARYMPPSTMVVQLLRDGRDVVTSGVFHWMKRKDAGQPRYRRYIDGEPLAIDRFFTDEDIEHWARHWQQPILAIDQHAPASLTIRYEEMLDDPHASLQRLFTHLSLPCDAAALRRCVEGGSFEVMSGGRRRGQEDPAAHNRKGVAGDWRQYFTRRDGELFDRIAGATLVDRGYEADRDWLTTLPERLDRDG